MRAKHFITDAIIDHTGKNRAELGRKLKVALFPMGPNGDMGFQAVIFASKDQYAAMREHLDMTLRPMGLMVRRGGEPLAAPIPAVLVCIMVEKTTPIWGSLPDEIALDDLPWVNHPAGHEYDTDGNCLTPDLFERMQAQQEAAPLYSIEPHGPEGHFVLYKGRGPMQHGLNLCTLSDWDRNGEVTRTMLEDALLAYTDIEACEAHLAFLKAEKQAEEEFEG